MKISFYDYALRQIVTKLPQQDSKDPESLTASQATEVLSLIFDKPKATVINDYINLHHKGN